MTLIKLVEYKLDSGSWPSGADISFRFLTVPIGPDLSCIPVGQWINCSSNSLTFDTNGYLTMYVNGVWRGVDPSSVSPNPSLSNIQADFGTIYGGAHLKYDIIV